MSPVGGPLPNLGPWFFEAAPTEGTWACVVPIAIQASSADGQHQGWLNIGFNNGNTIDKPGGLHLGVHYDIQVADGKIAPGSDLWMNNLYKSDQFQYRYPKDTIPMAQWFSTQPIPEIEGENTDDPILLGEREHLGE